MRETGAILIFCIIFASRLPSRVTSLEQPRCNRHPPLCFPVFCRGAVVWCRSRLRQRRVSCRILDRGGCLETFWSGFAIVTVDASNSNPTNHPQLWKCKRREGCVGSSDRSQLVYPPPPPPPREAGCGEILRLVAEDVPLANRESNCRQTCTTSPRSEPFIRFQGLPRWCCKFNHLHTCRLHGTPITEVAPRGLLRVRTPFTFRSTYFVRP